MENKETDSASPMEATEKQLHQLDSDNRSCGNYSILTDSFHVTLTEQRRGEYPSQSITLRRKSFDKLIAWYVKKQPLKPL